MWYEWIGWRYIGMTATAVLAALAGVAGAWRFFSAKPFLEAVIEQLRTLTGCDVEIRRDPESPEAHNNRYEIIVNNRTAKKQKVRVIVESFEPLGDCKGPVLGEDKNRDPLKFPVELSVKTMSEYALLPKSPTVFKFCRISDWFGTASIRLGTKDKEARNVFPKIKSMRDDGIWAKDFEPIRCVICVEINEKIEKRFIFELTPRKYTVPTNEEEPRNIPMVELIVRRI